MPRAKKGQRFGGRTKGVPNKATILRQTKQAEVIARTIDSGKPLAIEVLQKMMEFAEGAVAAFRPTLQADLQRPGVMPNADGNVEEFGKWFDRWFKTASELAAYQTAKIKPMEKPTAPPAPGENRKRWTLRVFEGGKQISGPGAADAKKDESAA